MRYPWLVALVAAAGCGTEGDDRPATAEYIVPAVFRPSCGTAACHSSQTGRKGLALDTIESTCDTISDESYSPLYQWTIGDGLNGRRMPLDSPLPEADIALMQRWFDETDDDPDPMVRHLAGCP